VRSATPVLAALLLLGGAAWAQDPLAQATDAYRKGEFRKAASLFAAAADGEEDTVKRADIRVKLAWTYFAMKQRSKAEEALAAALADSPALELVPDYYTQDFLKLFARVRTRAAASKPSATPTPAILSPASQLGQLRQRLAQATDPTTLEALLGDVQALEVAGPAVGAAEVVDVKADVLERLNRTSPALEARGRAAALRAAAVAPAGTQAVPLDAMMEARRLLALGRPADAAALLRGVLSAQPSCGPAMEVLAEALLEAGQLDDAYNAVRTALFAGDKPELLLSLGEVESRRGRLAGARDAFRRLVEVDPGNDRGWAALGLLEARLGEAAGARESLDKALAANPTLFEARVVRGEISLLDGQVPQALQHFQRALQVRPEDPWASGWLGVAELESDNAAAAADRLRIAIQAGKSQFLLPSAEAQRRLGHVEEAAAMLVTAPADDPRAVRLRARCLLDAGKPAEAQALLERLLATSPQDAGGRFLLGCALHDLRKWRAAATEFGRASALPGAPTSAADAARVAAATAAAQDLLDASIRTAVPSQKR
jgi:tetratricopeptide (TPR) repeat protein